MLIIKSGSPCNIIKSWQAFLNSQGCDAGTADGIWGAKATSATKCFQTNAGISVDGLVGPGTYQAAQDRGYVMPPIAVPEGNTNTMVDLSHYNGTVDLAKAKASGIQAVINKATEGMEPKYNDSSYATNRAAAAAAGLLWGAYHFGENADGAAQADHFLSIAKPDTSTLLVLDYEWLSRGSARNINIAQAVAFVNRILEVTGTRPGIYAGYGFKQDMYSATPAQQAALQQCWIWPAAYACSVSIPAGWSAYTFWQYTSNGYADGIGYCDRSYFKGTDDELASFWAQNAAKTAVS